MDGDELLDYVDQAPLPFPTQTGSHGTIVVIMNIVGAACKGPILLKTTLQYNKNSPLMVLMFLVLAFGLDLTPKISNLTVTTSIYKLHI
jgi:hypothetical protein